MPERLNDNDSKDVFFQFDSIAYKNPALALQLIEKEYTVTSKKTIQLQSYYFYYKGRFLLLMETDYLEAIRCLNKALFNAREQGLIELQIKIHQELSIAHLKQQEIEKSLKAIDTAFELAEHINYSQISRLYIDAGWIMHELDAGSPKAKMYLKKAIKKHNNINDSVFFAKVYHNLATLFLKNELLDSSLFYIKLAIPVFQLRGLNKLLCNAYNTLGAVYEKTNEHNKAIKYYELAANKGDKAGVETAFIYANIGRYYQYILKDNLKALNFYHISLEKPGNINQASLVQEQVAKIYEQSGQNKRALRHYKKSMMLKQAGLEKKYNENINKLEVQFEVKRKQHEINELELNARNQNLQIRNQRIFIVSLITFGLAVSAFLYLFFRQQSLVQNYEKVLLEQQLLRTQMTPHFIFNAISIIQYLIKNNENKQADTYLSKFSRLLRKCLENSTEQFTKIQDEIQLLEDYLALQALRFPDEFEYRINTYEEFDFDNALVPPMLIQPFIENSIEHGIRNIDRKGEIDITVKRNGKTIVCEITDNGLGISHNIEEGRNDKRSLSIKISKKRLAIIEKKLKIESKIEILDRMQTANKYGTKVVLTIPVQTT